MKRCVYLPPSGEGALYLTSVQVKDGELAGGWVVNGDWHLQIRPTEYLCRLKRGGKIVTRWPRDPRRRVVEVPDHIEGDYNAVIAWAEKQL